MKKISLVPCFMVVSLCAQAELQPISEYEMDGISGQAGIDLDLDVNVSIGEVRYTDTEVITQETIFVDDGNGNLVPQVIDVSDGDGGSLTISNISVGGGLGRTTLLGQPNPGNTANLDNLKFSVDISADGDLNIIGSPVPGGGIGIVDFLITTGEVALEGVDPADRHVLIDSMSIYGGALSMQVLIDGQTSDVQLLASIGIDDMDIDMSSSLGLTIENMIIAGADYSTYIQGGFNPTPQSRVAQLYVKMDTNTDPDAILFDFNSPLPNYNVMDVSVDSFVVGDGNLGSFFLDNLDINGLSFAVSGHN